MTALILCLYFFALLLLAVTSYGYTDPHLMLSTNALFERVHAVVFQFAYFDRPAATILFFSIVLVLSVCFLYFLKHQPRVWVIMLSVGILVLSYPSLTYDLFNYITTAKVAFTYHENPWLVMPIDIPNEPNLAFTRAANKVALYGPVWILFTALPHYLSFNTVWAAIIAFKFFNGMAYLLVCYLIWKWTKNYGNVLFFAFNPLVLLEVLANGHNDIYMMILAVFALRFRSWVTLVASWFVKEATLILTPLFFLKLSWEKTLVISYWFLAAVFFIAAPLREELYPWYAIWLIVPAAFLEYKKHVFLWQFTTVLSLALELRNLPYMWMGYYEGPGPMLRTLMTVIPVGVYLLWYFIRKKSKQS